MNKPIFGIALFFTVGILLGRYLTFPFLPLYLALLTFFGLSLIFYLKKKKALLSSSLFAIFLLIGALRFHYAYFPHSPSHILTFAPSGEKVKLTGKVLNHPQLKEGTIRFIMEAKKINSGEERRTEGRVWIVCYFPLENYSYGDTVRVEGKLSIPEGAREKGEFDWRRYLSYQGIWVELDTGKVDVIKRGGGSFLIKWAYKSRDWIVRVIEHTLPFPHSAVLKGIMLGDRESLPLEVRESFLRTGTGHILVVSGLHIGLILFLLLILFRVLALPSKLAFLIIIPLLGGYALLTGFSLPVLRATLMAAVGLIALIINRETPLLAILSLAFLIILFLNPLALFMASFQLSFAAVGGIIYLTPHLEALGNSIASHMRDNTSSGDASQKMKLKKSPPWLGKSLAISLAAQLSILPLLAF
ncbi:ComEC family competence protein [Candidatus Aerophobetes bacterium]|uniref:ComEC family competence protein n=1 Tax=Aerophobetes bacterium TaxID=2030807 RepID=A0A523RY16_UNCAE|nr:MAG: ComEC family competence protein [Candidatus Aerophobetes bacterium]